MATTTATTTRIVVTLFAMLEMIPTYYLFFERDVRHVAMMPGTFQIYTETVGNVDGMTSIRAIIDFYAVWVGVNKLCMTLLLLTCGYSNQSITRLLGCIVGFVGCFIYVIGEQNQIYQLIDITLHGLVVVQQDQEENEEQQQDQQQNHHQSLVVHNLMTNIITPIWFICVVLEFCNWYMYGGNEENDNHGDKKKTSTATMKKKKDE